MKKAFMAIAATGLSLYAIAATTSVSTVAGLIAAVRDAKANDEIVVMSSGSPYEFASTDFDLVGHLYATNRITLRGSTGNPADVKLVGNANRILYLAKRGSTIRDLTFMNGDCTGYSKRGTDVGEPYDVLRGGAICFRETNDGTVVSNCVFQSCNAVQGGGACAEYGNNSTGGKFYDCVFDGNSTVDNGGGGAIFKAISARSCVFRNNSAIESSGGAIYGVSEVVGCSIVSNAAPSTTRGFGGGVYGSTLTGCYIASNYAYRCGAAAGSKFYSCTNEANSAGDYFEFGLSTGGPGCYAEDCTFINVGSSSNKKIFGSTAFNRCWFGKGSFVTGSFVFSQWVALTNCLIANTSGYRLFDGLTSASAITSCTIASNSYTFANNKASYNPFITIRNCFFCGNNNGVDIPPVATNLVVSIDNCILSAEAAAYAPYAGDGSSNSNYYTVRTTFKPGFAGAAKDPENPYALTLRSPAVAKAGVVEDWMATATDIRGAGFPRLRDGKVNIGCYQCWDPILGFSIIFR